VRLRPLDVLDASRLEWSPPPASPPPAYLEIPGGAAGAMVRSTVRRAIGDAAAPLAAKLDRLERYFKSEFRSSGPDDLDPERLEEFLVSDRFGNCRHFATAAALLLRAAGVPTRLAAGFAGAELDEPSGEYVVWASSAHAWVEILCSDGWRPIDPMAWVDPSRGQSGSMAAGSAEREARPPRRKLDMPIQPMWILTAGAIAIAVALFWRRKRAAEPEPPPEEEQAAPPPPAEQPRPRPEPASRTEWLLFDYARLQEDLEGSGHERRAWETPREHGARVGGIEGPPSDGAFGVVVPLIDDGLYGRTEITDDDLADGRRAIDVLRSELL
jgi:hypothetical protein